MHDMDSKAKQTKGGIYMSRWTKKELSEIDNLTFAICILSERSASLNPYSLLATKLNSAKREIEGIRDERKKAKEII